MAIERNKVEEAIAQIKEVYGDRAIEPGEMRHLVAERLADENGVPFVDVGDGFQEPDYQHPDYQGNRQALNDNSDLLK